MIKKLNLRQKMKSGEKRVLSNLKNENLDRFAGSSDEEDEGKRRAPPVPIIAGLDSVSNIKEEYDDGNSENSDFEDVGYLQVDKYLDSNERNRNVGNDNDDGDDDDDLSSVEGEESDPASKMANVMSRILGTKNKGNVKKDASASSVVLAKTVTPLQKLQQKEKEQQKAMKERRQANRERNLTALHLPLSIATTNTIESGGQLSVAKELEQERFHRRVATRGVVALFNAITQHQRSNTADVCNSFNKKPSMLLDVPCYAIVVGTRSVLTFELSYFDLFAAEK